MKKFRSLGVFLSLSLLVFVACKKKKNDDNSTSNDNLTPITSSVSPFKVPEASGFLNVNFSSVTLHSGDNVTATANLFDANGNIQSTTVLIWQSSNTLIATVNSGAIHATSVGLCEVTVTDGIHGISSININVVPDSVSIPNTATQISWSSGNDLIIIDPNSTKPIPDHKIYDAKGTLLSSVVTFIPPANSDLSFSSGSITSKGVTGDFTVRMAVGADTLQNTLKVLVLKSTDTSYSLTSAGSLPYFFDNNISSERPLLLKVTKCWHSGGIVFQNSFITSPDKVQFSDNHVVLNNQGYLSSVSPTDKNYYVPGEVGAMFAVTLVKMIYKDQHLYSPVTVAQNIVGSWGCTTDNGKNVYNYCVTQSEPKIKYVSGASLYSFDASIDDQTIRGSYYIVKDGTQFFYDRDPTQFYGTYDSWYLKTRVNIYSDLFTLSIDGNSLQRWDQKLTLTRGAGICSSLDSILAKGGIRTWYGNACFDSAYWYNSIIFKNDHTVTIGSSSSATWTAPGNYIIFNGTDTFLVKSFTDKVIVFDTSGIYRVENGGCIPQWSTP
jgi:hypothetical protein